MESTSETDARGLSSIFGGSISKHPNKNVQVLTVSKDAEYYDMTHAKRGNAIIFNNRVFEKHTKLNERRGTEVDANNLYQVFRSLDFDVDMLSDLSARDMITKVEEYGKKDYSNVDCLVCCILTHGDLGVLYGRDGKFPTELMFAPFLGNACPTLVGKPKIFIIQACQGDRLDKGIDVVMNTDEADAQSQTYKIPVHADFLMAYSTVPGYYSWRNTAQGSWFVQALTSVFKDEGQSTDLLSLFTKINLRVAYDFISNVPNDYEMDKRKQVPCITSMLTRKVLFTPKH